MVAILLYVSALTLAPHAPHARQELARARMRRAPPMVCVLTEEEKALLTTSKRVTMIAKRFGTTQGRAAQAWVEEAIRTRSTNTESLMEMQLALFDECKLDDGGKCKELSDAIDMMSAAVEERKQLPYNEKLAASWRQQRLFGQSPIQDAATKVREAATKFGPEQKLAADEWIKKAARGGAEGSALLDGQVMLFGECVLSDGPGNSPSNCQLLSQTLEDLQLQLETCSVVEASVSTSCDAEAVIETITKDASPTEEEMPARVTGRKRAAIRRIWRSIRGD